jgi:DNA-binding transcriptional ArsR family regulator
MMAEPTKDAENVTPEKAFSLLGNETRVAIIQVLGEASNPLSFSAVRERVGTRDSGQFNYHLTKLVGSFVRRTDEGYELSYAGHRIVGAIHSGTYRRGDRMNFDLDSTCTVCETTIKATYENERVTVRCPGCETRLSEFGFPPGGFENRTITELTQVFGQYVDGIFSFMLRGICLNCSGKTVGKLIEETDRIDDDAPAYVEVACDQCGELTTSHVNGYLLHHPAVASFHYDHGIDLDRSELWNLDLYRNESLTLLSSDPLSVGSTIELDGDRLDLVISEDLSVSVETDR